VSFEHPCVSLESKVRVEERKAVLTLDVATKCSELPAADYPEFRAAAQKAPRELQNEIAFALAPSTPNQAAPPAGQ